MAKINSKFFYVGHGAMNYLQIFDDDDSIVCQILIDAGCNDDKTDGNKRRSNIAFVKGELLKNKEVNTIVLLTHFHDDHYNLLCDLITAELQKAWLLAGSLADNYFSDNPENKLVQLFYRLQNHGLVLSQIKTPIKIFNEIKLPDGVEFYCLWNNYFTQITERCIKAIFPSAPIGRNYNSNGAAFALCLRGNALLFLGDMTGANFGALLNDSDLRTSINKIFGKSHIWMTVPHHGSLDTLISEPSGKPFVYLDDSTGYYNTGDLQSVFTEVFSRPCGMYISAGYLDQYFHPDCVASVAYECCGNGEASQGDSLFLAYKCISCKWDAEQGNFETLDGKSDGWGRLSMKNSNTVSTCTETRDYWEKEI